MYEYHDVIKYRKHKNDPYKYYMSTGAGSYLNTYEPGGNNNPTWKEVFWFKDKATATNPMLGWSTTSDAYTCALDVYK